MCGFATVAVYMYNTFSFAIAFVDGMNGKYRAKMEANKKQQV
jgi:hypothetical protein